MYPESGSMMYPSSMAWRIGYRWNDPGISRPLSSTLPVGRPNSVMVSAFGVAVNAKNDTLEGIAFAACMRVKYSAIMSSSVASESCRFLATASLSLSEAMFNALFNAAALLPSCAECASSMMTAKSRPARVGSVAIIGHAYRNVCKVTTMISRRSDRALAT